MTKFENFKSVLNSEKNNEEYNRKEKCTKSSEEHENESENLYSKVENEMIEDFIIGSLFKPDLKRKTYDINEGKDNYYIFQNPKQLGIFVAFYKESEYDLLDTKNSNFSLLKGEYFIDLHLPPLNIRGRKKILVNTKKSLELLAKYIQVHNLHPKYILGFTYEKLANISKRYGFKVIDLKIPEEIRRGVERIYRLFVESENKTKKSSSISTMGKVLLCYQTCEDFLNRFLKQDSNEH